MEARKSVEQFVSLTVNNWLQAQHILKETELEPEQRLFKLAAHVTSGMADLESIR